MTSSARFKSSPAKHSHAVLVRRLAPRLRRAGHWLLIGVLFVSLGGHLALLQTLAWGKMFVDYSDGASLVEAAKKTFDGDHPCPMCKVVKQSREDGDKKPLLKAESKMEVALPSAVILKFPLPVVVGIPVPGYFGRDCEVSLGVPLQPPERV